MSLAGIRQIEKLIVYYSPIGGSSRGMREFLSSPAFVDFQKNNSDLPIVVHPRNGVHPYIESHHKFSVLHRDRIRRPWTICVKNAPPKEIQRFIDLMMNSSGRQAKVLKRRQHTFYPSIQGTWTPNYFRTYH